MSRSNGSTRVRAVRSPYKELFGDSRVGRPIGTAMLRAGDPSITARASRRARRVLVAENSARYEELLSAEIRYLQSLRGAEE